MQSGVKMLALVA